MASILSGSCTDIANEKANRAMLLNRSFNDLSDLRNAIVEFFGEDVFDPGEYRVQSSFKMPNGQDLDVRGNYNIQLRGSFFIRLAISGHRSDNVYNPKSPNNIYGYGPKRVVTLQYVDQSGLVAKRGWPTSIYADRGYSLDDDKNFLEWLMGLDDMREIWPPTSLVNLFKKRLEE